MYNNRLGRYHMNNPCLFLNTHRFDRTRRPWVLYSVLSIQRRATTNNTRHIYVQREAKKKKEKKKPSRREEICLSQKRRKGKKAYKLGFVPPLPEKTFSFFLMSPRRKKSILPESTTSTSTSIFRIYHLIPLFDKNRKENEVHNYP